MSTTNYAAMGKKSSHKKHRQPQASAKPKAPSQIVSQRSPMELASLTAEGAALPVTPAQKAPGFGEQSQFIRADIQRIVLLLLVVGVLLAAALVWNAKRPSLFNAGKKMASFMQLQQN